MKIIQPHPMVCTLEKQVKGSEELHFLLYSSGLVFSRCFYIGSYV